MSSSFEGTTNIDMLSNPQLLSTSNAFGSRPSTRSYEHFKKPSTAAMATRPVFTASSTRAAAVKRPMTAYMAAKTRADVRDSM